MQKPVWDIGPVKCMELDPVCENLWIQTGLGVGAYDSQGMVDSVP